MILKGNALTGALKSEKGGNWISVRKIIGRNFEKLAAFSSQHQFAKAEQ